MSLVPGCIGIDLELGPMKPGPPMLNPVLGSPMVGLYSGIAGAGLDSVT